MAVFSMLLLTGDPLAVLTTSGEAITPEQIAEMRHQLGLDRPLPVQYIDWLGKVLRGDFGRSVQTQRQVITEIISRIPVTLQLGGLAWLFSVFIAIPVGVTSATKRGSKLDLLATAGTIGGLAIPGFWLGMMLIVVFGVVLRWLPTYGFVSIFDNPIDGLKHLILPAFSLGLAMAAQNMRQTRSAMLEVLAQDYIRTARAKGLHERNVIWRHGLKNALLPVVTLMGLQIGRLLGGTVVIETLFAIPGMGRLMVHSILRFDFPIVQACVLVVGVAVLIANLATDLLYGYLDPRIRYT